MYRAYIHTVNTVYHDTEPHVTLQHTHSLYLQRTSTLNRTLYCPTAHPHTVATAYRGLERCPDKVGGPRGGPDLGDREGYIRWS